MPDPTDLIDTLIGRRTSMADRLEADWTLAQRSGREQPTDDEQRRLDDIKGLSERISELVEDAQRMDNIAATTARFGGTPTPGTRSTMSDSHLVYARRSRNSWVRDFVLHQVGSDDNGECRGRLLQHAEEVRTDPAFMEHRDLSRVDGSGGFAVPPAWLMDQYVELARPGRAFANLCQRMPLPGGTDSINVPKLNTGTAVGIQSADNVAVTSVDLTDTYVTAPVRTIAGEQSVSIQLLDQSPTDFSSIVFGDLVAAHAAATDLQVLNGSGAAGQVLGTTLTPGIQTVAASAPTITGVYSAIANAIQKVHTRRFLPPTVIVMHPRRWGWFLSLLDNQDRPLFLPVANGLNNAAGILSDVDSQCIVGQMQGLPVVTDPNISVTDGSESPVGTEDPIFVMRASDLVLYESGIRARTLNETKASNLTVILQIYSYVSYTAGRHPESVVQITGLPTPTFA